MKDTLHLRDMLRSVVEDVAEHAAYLRELGIESLEYEINANALQPSAAASRATPLSPPDVIASTPARALSRNANAESRAASVPSIHKRSVVAPRVGEAAAVAPDQPDMAKQTSRRSIAAPDTPAPMETLFGIVTPMDEATLPRPDETLEDIRRDIGECIRCPLSQSRHKVVNSEGYPQARLMFVGEAPGADEDAQGRPFVGRAGQLLNKIIEAIGMKREEIFIGNVNRCRPPQNRTPTPPEASTCKPFLLREIDVVKPEVIVVLGNTAMKNLLGTKEGITKLRGEFQDYRGIKVMPTFHPAYLLRDPSKKRETWDDMKKVRDYLNHSAVTDDK